MFKRKPSSVEYYLEGREAWQYGFIGRLIRVRNIVIQILIQIFIPIFFLTAPPWWAKLFHPLLSDYVVINSTIYYTGIFLYCCILQILVLIYLRKRTLRSLNIKYYLHQLAHQIRDKEAEFYKQTNQGEDYSKLKIEEQLKNYLHQLVELLKKYFKLLLNQKHIEVAIRLASIEQENKVVYKTYARSSGLNPRRQKYSEPISKDEGIASVFRNQKGGQGVLIYNDIKQASKENMYKWTKNDDKFPNEINTIMVVPMNAWDKNSMDMIGLLYVTSNKKNIFGEKDVDALSFAADMIASTISNILNIISYKHKGNTINKQENE
jgi:hypothetical protein